MAKVEIFSGVRVIELAQYVMVPSAGAMLADFGGWPELVARDQDQRR